MGYEIRFGPWQGPSASFYFMTVFFFFFFCQGLYIGTLKCRGSIIVYIHTYIHLGAGKHPSPLDISESYSPDLYLKVGFYLIKKYCSCPKLSQFKDRAIL